MPAAWKCERCATVHSQNPAECRSCSHGIFEPVSEAELEAMGDGIDAPESMDLSGRSAPSSKEASVESSPDVAADGSLVREGAQESETEDAGLLARVRSRLQIW